MSLQFCNDCTAAHYVGAPECPQCGSTDIDDWVTHMAKIGETGPTHTIGEEPEEWMPPVTEESVPEHAEEPRQETKPIAEAEQSTEPQVSMQDQPDTEVIHSDQPVVIKPAEDEKSDEDGKAEEKS